MVNANLQSGSASGWRSLQPCLRDGGVGRRDKNEGLGDYECESLVKRSRTTGRKSCREDARTGTSLPTEFGPIVPRKAEGRNVLSYLGGLGRRADFGAMMSTSEAMSRTKKVRGRPQRDLASQRNRDCLEYSAAKSTVLTHLGSLPPVSDSGASRSGPLVSP